MTDLKMLYQDLIVEHNRHPRNFGDLAQPTHAAIGHNPLCGDKLKVQLRIADDTLQDIRFQGEGCAICMASSSLMTQAVKGKTLVDVKRLHHLFHEAMTMRDMPSETTIEHLGKLSALLGVREFPVRVKCATLAWHTLAAALKNDAVVTTEQGCD